MALESSLPGTIDVLVVGSGVAGLSAAIEARVKGVRVRLVEAQETLGGASVISAGGCCIVDSPLQRRAGILDTKDQAMSEWLALGGPTVDQAWARKYVENSKVDVYDWLEQLGTRWVALRQCEGNGVARWHEPEGWGRAIVQALLERAVSLGVDIRTSSRVKRLLVRDSVVQGAEIEAHQTSYTILSPNVIICTGGFSGNITKVLEWAASLQTLPRLLSGGGHGSLGQGHDMLVRDADADLCCLDHIWVYPGGTPDPSDPSGKRGIGPRSLLGAIWLNSLGHRFHNEHLSGPLNGLAALLAQPGQTAWMVFHVSEIEHLTFFNNPAYFPPPTDGGVLPAIQSFWEDSPYAWRVRNAIELAQATGLPVDAVKSTIETFNADIFAGLSKDSRYGRPLTNAVPLESDLAVIQISPMVQKTFGGVRTDLDCRVLNRSGKIIEGLYAAGEVAGMAGGCINGKAALEGTMFGPCLYSGRVAGMSAHVQ